MRASLNRVVISNRFGNDVNLTGSATYIETSRITIDNIRLKLIRISRRNGGSGTNKTSRIITAPIGTVKCEKLLALSRNRVMGDAFILGTEC